MIKINVHHKPFVGTHVNPYGVEVQNGEGTRDPAKVGYYMEAVTDGKHVVGRQFLGDDWPTAESKEAFRQACDSGTAPYEIF